MSNLLFLHLADVFDEACAVFEADHGEPPNHKIEKLLACRIADLAKTGEWDSDRLRESALEGLITQAYCVKRASLN